MSELQQVGFVVLERNQASGDLDTPLGLGLLFELDDRDSADDHAEALRASTARTGRRERYVVGSVFIDPTEER